MRHIIRYTLQFVCSLFYCEGKVTLISILLD